MGRKMVVGPLVSLHHIPENNFAPVKIGATLFKKREGLTAFCRLFGETMSFPGSKALDFSSGHGNQVEPAEGREALCCGLGLGQLGQGLQEEKGKQRVQQVWRHTHTHTQATKTHIENNQLDKSKHRLTGAQLGVTQGLRIGMFL